MSKQVLRGVYDVNGRKVSGTLTLDGRKSTFELWDDEFFFVPAGAVHGTTTDAKAVSVLECLRAPPAQSSNLATKRRGYKADVKFHLAVVGDADHLEADDESIIALRFTFDELKYVARTGIGGPYGFIPDPHPQIIESLRTHKPEWTPDVEDAMSLIYFGGDPTVLPETATVIGTVSITRGLSGTLQDGIALDDTPSVTIDFGTRVTIHTAMDRMRALRCFFALAIGHLPTVQVADLATSLLSGGKGTRHPDFNLRVHSLGESVLRKRELANCRPGLCLLDCDGKERKDELAAVMANWFRRNADIDRQAANWRFFDCFLQRVYSTDRMTGAANMFDLLPKKDWRHPKLKDLKKKVRYKADLILQSLGAQDLPEVARGDRPRD